MTKILYGQDDKRFDQEYWGQLERNWKKQGKGKERLERIDEEEEEEAKFEEERIEKWDEEDKMGKLYNKL